MAVSIEERARRWITKMPAAFSGQAGHAATFHVACVLVQGFGLSLGQAMPLLQEFNARCVPPWSDRELAHKLDGAEKAPGLKRQDGHVLPRGCLINAIGFKPSKVFREYHKIEPPKKPEFDNSALGRFAGEWAGAVDLLWLAARSDQDPCTVSPSRFLELLYRHGEKILVFTDNKSQGDFVYEIGRVKPSPPPRGLIPDRGPHGVWFLAQPVDGEYHPNPRQGTMSRRSEEAVTSWRYFVIESDQAKLRTWLGAIVQFPLRIAAIYSSGGRSVHVLVKIDARTKAEWDSEREAMKAALVILGADAGAMTAVRLTRLPGCYRGTGRGRPGSIGGNLQKLLYINPDPPMRPICEFSLRRDVLKPWLDWAAIGVGDSDETGGASLTHALNYYAPVSEQCRRALRNLSGAKSKTA